MNVFLKRKQENVKKSALNAAHATRKKSKNKHKQFKEQAIKLWESDLNKSNNFKKFMMAYSCEGDKKSKWAVGICNSNAALMTYFYNWFKKINIHDKKIQFRIQLHVDQDKKGSKLLESAVEYT